MYYLCKMKKKSGRSNVRIKTADIDKTIQFVKACSNIYFNNQHLLIDLSGKEMSFLLFLVEKMGHNNEINIDIKLKSSYIGFVSEITSKKKKISISSVDKYLKKLRSIGYVILLGSLKSTHYLVNPKYFYRSSELSRTHLIEKIITSRIKKKESIEHLIDCPEHDFFNKAVL